MSREAIHVEAGADRRSGIPEAARVLVDFAPSKDFFVGVDSDGCALDAMDITHQEWGDGVNVAIADMVHGCGPFPGVRDAMEAMYDVVDEMTVSATPVDAQRREWAEHGLARYVRVIAGQDMGIKAEHVQYAAVEKFKGTPNQLVWTEKWQSRL